MAIPAPLSRFETALLLALWIGVPVGYFALIAGLGGIGFALSTPILTVGLIGVLLSIILGWILVGGQHASVLVLDERGILIRTWLRSRQFLWSEARPGNLYRADLPFHVRFASSSGSRAGLYSLSLQQARALLSDGRAPRHLFPPEAWAKAGLSSPKIDDIS